MTTHVFETMGTMVSLRWEGDGLATASLQAVEDVFRSFDETYSLYRPASPLSRIARGELSLADADESIRDAYATALEWRASTAGTFTPHRPDGVVDLSGLVKAQAMAQAGDELDRHGDSWLLTVGGDVLSRGDYVGGPWRVGIVDPLDRSRLVGVASLGGDRRALATSGVGERGQHIWRRGGEVYVQATVAAADIVTADVVATAIVAGSADDFDLVTSTHDVDVLAFDAVGSARATPGARAWLDG